MIDENEQPEDLSMPRKRIEHPVPINKFNDIPVAKSPMNHVHQIPVTKSPMPQVPMTKSQVPQVPVTKSQIPQVPVNKSQIQFRLQELPRQVQNSAVITVRKNQITKPIPRPSIPLSLSSSSLQVSSSSPATLAPISSMDHIAQNNHRQTFIPDPRTNQNHSSSFHTPRTFNNPKSTSLSSLDSLNGQTFLRMDGLKLISEVASRVSSVKTQSSDISRPTVLRAPSKPTPVYSMPVIKPNAVISTQKSNVTYAPPSPKSPIRSALRDGSSWSYHPYLPLAVYALPNSSYPMTPPNLSSNKILIDSRRHRNGSVSPPEADHSSSSPSGSESSGSNSSPEGPPTVSRLSCSDCGRRYATLAGLTRHKQFHCSKEAAKSFDCKHCEKTYTSLGALKMHIRTHTLPCKCHLCGKAFSRPWLLQGHIRTHTGEKPFQCNQCDRCFADRSNLRAHLQTHADVKKYACRTCPKTFSRMSLLTKHEDHGCPGLSRSIGPQKPLSLAPMISSPIQC